MTEEVQNHPEPIKPASYDQTVFEMYVKSVKTTTVGGLRNVVKEISWSLIATHNGKKYEIERTTEFQANELQDLQNFVPYENLAKEVVQGWIEARTPMLHLKYTMCNNIDAEQAQDTQQPSLPWSN